LATTVTIESTLDGQGSSFLAADSLVRGQRGDERRRIGNASVHLTTLRPNDFSWRRLHEIEQRKHRAALDARWPGRGRPTGAAEQPPDLYADLIRRLNRLSPLHREIVLLLDDGHSIRAIAALLGVSNRTAQREIQRIRQNFAAWGWWPEKVESNGPPGHL
jgi:DNA-directed RNA polymerase specialized sigma24 family protein